MRYTPKQKCYEGNPIDLIMGSIIDALEGPFKDIAASIGQVFSGITPTDGANTALALDAKIRAICRESNRHGHGDADKCYYERAHEICTNDQLYKDFLQLNGRDHDLNPHTPRDELRVLNKVVDGIDMFRNPLGLCRDAVQITLDMVVEGCIFAKLTGNPETNQKGLCNAPRTEKMLHILKNTTWELPKVRFVWGAPYATAPTRIHPSVDVCVNITPPFAGPRRPRPSRRLQRRRYSSTTKLSMSSFVSAWIRGTCRSRISLPTTRS